MGSGGIQEKSKFLIRVQKPLSPLLASHPALHLMLHWKTHHSPGVSGPLKLWGLCCRTCPPFRLSAPRRPTLIPHCCLHCFQHRAPLRQSCLVSVESKHSRAKRDFRNHLEQLCNFLDKETEADGRKVWCPKSHIKLQTGRIRTPNHVPRLGDLFINGCQPLSFKHLREDLRKMNRTEAQIAKDFGHLFQYFY